MNWNRYVLMITVPKLNNILPVLVWVVSRYVKSRWVWWTAVAAVFWCECPMKREVLFPQVQPSGMSKRNMNVGFFKSQRERERAFRDSYKIILHKWSLFKLIFLASALFIFLENKPIRSQSQIKNLTACFLWLCARRTKAFCDVLKKANYFIYS